MNSVCYGKFKMQLFISLIQLVFQTELSIAMTVLFRKHSKLKSRGNKIFIETQGKLINTLGLHLLTDLNSVANYSEFVKLPALVGFCFTHFRVATQLPVMIMGRTQKGGHNC